MARPKRSANAAPRRFDITTLQKLAGNKVFARGVDRDGQVEIVSIDRSRVLARVMGSEI
jgi:hypothetical protein